MVTPNVALINVIGTGLPDEPALRRAPVRYARATWLLARQGDGGWRITALRVLPSEDDRSSGEAVVGILDGDRRADPERRLDDLPVGRRNEAWRVRFGDADHYPIAAEEGID